MCEIHLRRNANQRPNSWEYEKTPFFRRINKKLLSHHEAYEGDEGFGKLFTFQFLNFVPLATFVVKSSFSFGFSARASTRVRFPERGE